jgi:hypothetical protein
VLIPNFSTLQAIRAIKLWLQSTLFFAQWQACAGSDLHTCAPRRTTRITIALFIAVEPPVVTLVGQEILRGRHINVGGVSPRDWLHFIISLLCHDIGDVRGICRADENGQYVSNLAGDKVTLAEGATDAALTPYHVARSKLFVRERFSNAIISLDVPQIEKNIEHTRFPVPEDEAHESTVDAPGLVRAADLIGQLADINYLRKQPALFNEFRETGTSEKLGYKSVADLRDNYPDFFWQKVRPYIGDALRYLRITQEGQQWVANLYANVFSMEHRALAPLAGSLLNDSR